MDEIRHRISVIDLYIFLQSAPGVQVSFQVFYRPVYFNIKWRYIYFFEWKRDIFILIVYIFSFGIPIAAKEIKMIIADQLINAVINLQETVSPHSDESIFRSHSFY